jgi:hypothetical protein
MATDPIYKQDAAELSAKIASMSDEQKDARVQEIYAIPSEEVSPEQFDEFFAMMFGG